MLARPIRLALAVLAFASLAGAAFASDPAAATAAQVRAADAAFAARAAAAGTAEAFREYMDGADGLQFGRGAPIRGAEAIYQAMGGAAPARSRLEWTPTDAWGAASGDLGVTTGTWKSVALDASRPPLTGRYVTVWRKDGKGAWKGLIDIGTTDAP
ncbi:MAG TPA: nuclear transport factor 2 family protein [Caulobacteraceae bacterium]|jgi:ketosteroid isomerase-like protein